MKREKIKAQETKTQKSSFWNKVGNHATALFVISVIVGWGSIFYRRPIGIEAFLPGPQLIGRGWPWVFLRCTTQTIVCQTSYWPMVKDMLFWFVALSAGWAVIFTLGWGISFVYKKLSSMINMGPEFESVMEGVQ